MKILRVLLLGFFCGCVVSAWSQDDNLAQLTVKERNAMQAKALFLYNFANFVEWPDEAFPNSESPLRMCLYGDVPFGTFLDVIAGAKIGERLLTVTRSTEVAEISTGCQILFVGQDKNALLPEFWKKIQYFYVLSIGEQEQFADKGGIINILRTTDRVHFQINITNAMGAGLFLSSDLLSLAREIKRNTTETAPPSVGKRQ